MNDQPLLFLEENIGAPVWIISRKEVEYTGLFEGFDQSLNVVLKDVKVHGPEGATVEHSKALIRRDQIEMVIPNPV